MKKKNIQYPSATCTAAAWILCACALLCSCGNDAPLSANLTGVPLGVDNLRLDAAPATRAGGTPVTTTGATIGVFLTDQAGYRPAYNKTYTYNISGQWSSTDPVYVDNRVGKVVAFYDPNNLVSFGTSTTLTTTTWQAQAYAENKLWYYDNTSGTAVSNASPTVAFSMKCAYARLSFSISRDAGYPLPCKISGIEVKPTSGTFHTAAKVNIADGTLTDGNSASSQTIDTSTLSINTSGIAVGATNTDIDWLFPAQTLETGAGLSFTLTVDGSNYTANVPAATFNRFDAGVRYTVQLQMASPGITVSGVTTTDWVTSATDINSKFD